ncbi:hypothetical protein [Caldanaerobacter subterraneus]|uniref:hypothetical protein n=1 Tax=Caldanaerobacter subterraneus TaxID=911092 RepID=UPI0019F6CFA4|nr:hypothetical protein [Caldanaerobacter subterraneus]
MKKDIQAKKGIDFFPSILYGFTRGMLILFICLIFTFIYIRLNQNLSNDFYSFAYKINFFISFVISIMTFYEKVLVNVEKNIDSEFKKIAISFCIVLVASIIYYVAIGVVMPIMIFVVSYIV